MKCDYVTFSQQLVEVGEGDAAVLHRCRLIDKHTHRKGIGNSGNLLTDFTITDDTERFSFQFRRIENKG